MKLWNIHEMSGLSQIICSSCAKPFGSFQASVVSERVVRGRMPSAKAIKDCLRCSGSKPKPWQEDAIVKTAAWIQGWL